MIDVQLSATELDVQKCLGFVRSDEAGGIDIFIGTVRNTTKGKPVIRLEFEAYESMAVNKMKQIAEQATEKWDLAHVVVHHRTGVLNVGEIPVVIAASSAHRANAFDACRYIIDTLKETVPIWKKEFFTDGEVWVNAHP